MVVYENDGKFAYFNGLKFTRDDKTGYYLNSTIRERLHRKVWEFFHGEIPSGYEIHHKDGDKTRNDIEDLELLPRGKHKSEHAEQKYANDKAWFEKFHSAGIEKAKEWHKSQEGREWHREHAAECWKGREPKEYACSYCGKNFETTNRYAEKDNTFCSNKCKSAWRRKAGVDDEIRTCVCCKKEFSTNRYSKAKCCSKSCSNRLFPRLPQLRKNKEH